MAAVSVILLLAASPLAESAPTESTFAESTFAEPALDPDSNLEPRAGLGFDAQLAAFAQLAEDAQTTLDARDAEAILAGLPLPRARPIHAAPDAAIHAAASPRPPAIPAADDAGLAALAHQQAGSADGLILTWQQRLGSDASLGNVVGLRHASGPVEAQMQVSGRLPLARPGPLALSYDGSAWVRVLPPLALGAVARGPLGTLGAPRVGPVGQSIGPDALLALPGLGGTLAAETGWRIPLGAGDTGKPLQPGEFHLKLSFQKQL